MKKHATGSGRAEKAAVVQAANTRWGLALPINYHLGEVHLKGRKIGQPMETTFPGFSDNVADALWIADTARSEITGQVIVPPGRRTG